MCGIYGIFSNEIDLSYASILGVLKSYNLKRGPDEFGELKIPNLGYIGHCRLSIQDKNNTGSQPAFSSSGRYVVIYNGEIYSTSNNDFANNVGSDTDFLVNLIDQKGARQALESINGMFALVIFDKFKNCLYFARDRFGMKPLYYQCTESKFLFSSSFKSLIEVVKPENACELEVYRCLRLGSMSNKHTVWQEIKQCKPGYIYKLELPNYQLSYQRLEQDRQSTLKFKDVLSKSVSDHEVGEHEGCVLLSSGLDSASIAEHSQFNNMINLTFAEYVGTNYDEQQRAERIANYYNKNFILHCEDDYSEQYNKFLNNIDVPTIDGFNVWLITKRISELGFKFALSGAGADELLFGYSHYERSLMSCLQILQFFKNGFSSVPEFACGAYIQKRSIARLKDLRDLYTGDELKDLESQLQSEMLNEIKLPDVRVKSFDLNRSFVQIFNNIETENYLKTQVVRDADWASMSNGVELRLPFLDCNLWSWRDDNINDVINKRKTLLLPDSAPKWYPKNKKQGFYTPLINQTNSGVTISNLNRMREILALFGLVI